MRTLLVSTLALGALTTAALAEPVALTDVQMDRVTAGGQVAVLSPGTTEIRPTNGAAIVFVENPDEVFTQNFICNPGQCGDVNSENKQGHTDINVAAFPQNN